MSKWMKWLLAPAVVAVVLACGSPRSAEAGWRHWWGPAPYGAWYFSGVGSPTMFYVSNGEVTLTAPLGVIVTPRSIVAPPRYAPYIYYTDPRLPYAGYYFRPY